MPTQPAINDPMKPTQTPAVATHTPTPWHVGMKPGPFIYGPQGEQVADMTGACTFNGKQDAAFIVRACNSHAQLVAALSAMYCAGFWTADELPNLPPHQRKAIEEARAALQAAKE